MGTIHAVRVDDAAKAGLLMDMVFAGIGFETGEVPFAWLAAAPVSVPEAKQEGSVRVAEAAPTPVVKRELAVLAALPPMAKRAAPAALPKAHVWAVGEPGGLAVVVRTSPAAVGQVPLAGAELALLGKMLVALGLPAEVGGWVGLGQLDEMVRPEMTGELVAAVKGLAPARVLVLGGAALGTLLGKACGVEGWQQAPVGWEGLDVGMVGVTYPPQLLLEKPVFKRLAWQHLLAWQARFDGKGDA